MRWDVDKNKIAIRNGSAFDGLRVPDRDKIAALFLMPQFHLVNFGGLGHVIFEVHENSFVFHLVNFTKAKTVNMTEAVMENFVIPFCNLIGLRFIQARVERPGMARKLERLGFENFSGNCYRRAV